MLDLIQGQLYIGRFPPPVVDAACHLALCHTSAGLPVCKIDMLSSSVQTCDCNQTAAAIAPDCLQGKHSYK